MTAELHILDMRVRTTHTHLYMQSSYVAHILIFIFRVACPYNVHICGSLYSIFFNKDIRV
jgi:hypothetical protein